MRSTKISDTAVVEEFCYILETFLSFVTISAKHQKLRHIWRRNKLCRWMERQNSNVLCNKYYQEWTALQNFGVVRYNAMKSSPLLGPFGDLEFWEFSLLKIWIGWVLWCFKLQTIVSCALIHSTLLSIWLLSEVWYIIAPNLS